MIGHHRINTLIACLFLCVCSFGCTPKEPEPNEQSVVKPAVQNQAKDVPVKEIPVKEIQIPDQKAPSTDPFWIASLKSSSNRVDFKSKSESIWQAVTADMKFYKYDSIQTHRQSTAQVRYQSKSEIEVSEKSLLVFDEDPGSKKKKIDRVILKTGDLLGKTSTELWVLTDAGLVQISAGKLKSAKARVQIKDQLFKVQVENGTAFITAKNRNNEIQKILVTQNNAVELNMEKQIQPIMANFEDFISAALAVTQPTEQKVILENGNETEVTNKTVYQLNGKLSAIGAKLLLNGELVQVNSDLSFSKAVNLTKGSNLVVLQLIRSDSTTQFFRKKVVLED